MPNTTNLLKRLRNSIKKHSEDFLYGNMKSTEKILLSLTNQEDVISSIVEDYTEDRGDRWNEWEITIYKLEIEEKEIYFKIEKEVGKTELQSNPDCVIVSEVIPKEVIKIEYEEIEPNTNL